MGCRTRARKYYANMGLMEKQYNDGFAPYVDGSLAMEPDYKERIEIKRRKRVIVRNTGKYERILSRQRHVFITAFAICAVSIFALCIAHANIIETRNLLTDEITDLQNEIQEVSIGNDSHEFEIDSIVDMEYIVDSATNILGMVRSTPSQVVSYTASDNEYIQQVAEVPAN